MKNYYLNYKLLVLIFMSRNSILLVLLLFLVASCSRNQNIEIIYMVSSGMQNNNIVDEEYVLSHTLIKNNTLGKIILKEDFHLCTSKNCKYH